MGDAVFNAIAYVLHGSISIWAAFDIHDLTLIVHEIKREKVSRS